MVRSPRLFSCRLGVLGGSAIIFSNGRTGYQLTGSVNIELNIPRDMTQPATAEPATQVNQQALSLRSTRQSTDSHSALDNDNDNFDK